MEERRSFVLSDFNFELPSELLAQQPAGRREESRLMVVYRGRQTIEHRTFSEIGSYLNRGDVLVLNNTKVIPARLSAVRADLKRGARFDVLLVREADWAMPAWIMLLDPLRKVKVGMKLAFQHLNELGEVAAVISEKEVLIAFPDATDRQTLRAELFKAGSIPLPPYIKRMPDPLDGERYQTVYASVEGALAAPTAGLHFSPDLLESLEHRGITRAEITLHIGLGTFNPIYVEDLNSVSLHSEEFEVSPGSASLINAAFKRNSLVVSVGTTSLRTLESVAQGYQCINPGRGETDLFIKPGFKFNTAQALLTNFHTPKSSLLMMIASYMGYNFMMQAYQEAIKAKYRFYSYGDAMLILP